MSDIDGDQFLSLMQCMQDCTGKMYGSFNELVDELLAMYTRANFSPQYILTNMNLLRQSDSVMDAYKTNTYYYLQKVLRERFGMETGRPFRLFFGIVALYRQLGSKKVSAPVKIYSLEEQERLQKKYCVEASRKVGIDLEFLDQLSYQFAKKIKRAEIQADELYRLSNALNQRRKEESSADGNDPGAPPLDSFMTEYRKRLVEQLQLLVSILQIDSRFIYVDARPFAFLQGLGDLIVQHEQLNVSRQSAHINSEQSEFITK